MSAETAIYSQLSGTGAITAIVGANIFQDDVPPEQANVYPRVVWTVDDDDPDLTFNGPSGLVEAKIVISSFATTKGTRDALAEAVKRALDDQAGAWGGVPVQGCFYEDQKKYVETDPMTNRRIAIADQEYRLWHVFTPGS